MSRHGYKNNPEFIKIVRKCAKGNVTYAAAVSELQESGFDISERTYGRRKMEIKKLDENRLEHLATVEYPQFTVDTIDTAKKL